MGKIEETELSLEQMDMIGGEVYPILEVEMVLQPTRYKVVEATGKATQWGQRVDYVLESEQGYRYKISSWNFTSKEKFKPTELIGKYVTLAKWTEKKFKLSF